jgi:hypothetical protein
MNKYDKDFTLAGYPATVSIRLDIRPDTGYKKADYTAEYPAHLC